MLSAKLFAILTAVLLGVALLESKATHQGVDVYVQATTFVFGRVQLAILMAANCAWFALIYFVFARWASRPLNNSLGLAHFALVTVGFALLFLFLNAIPQAAWEAVNPHLETGRWGGFEIIAGGICYLLSCFAFAVNCGRTFIRIIRSHRQNPS